LGPGEKRVHVRLSLAPSSAAALFGVLNSRWVELAPVMGSDLYALAGQVDPDSPLKMGEVEGKFAAVDSEVLETVGLR
jgi:hypothetical protein